MLAAIQRTGSFSAAAAELGQTQSTVSHKIRALEERLGYAVFSRTTRQVEPTRRGLILCEAARATVEATTAALNRIDNLSQSRDTVVTLSSSLAMKWLIPAMPRAQARGLRLSLQIDDGLSEIGADGQPQIAIRFGTGPYPGLYAEFLSKSSVIAVRGKSARPLERATQDHPAPLLRDSRAEADGTAMSWEAYLAAIGQAALPTTTGAQFDRTDLAIQAAVGGLGHALGRTLLIEADIGDGLLAVDGPAIPLPGRYWLVTTPEHAQTQSYKQTAEWLKSEVARSQHLSRKYLAESPSDTRFGH